MADITTTTEEEGERMSDLTDTIDRLEQWAEYWEPHQPAEFIADLRTLTNAAKTISRAIDWLQKAQRYNCGTKAYRPEIMVCYTDGTWMRFDDVRAAIDILQEGRQ